MDKIICFGKNYLEHAQELGDATPELPVVFLKPPSVLKHISQWENKETIFIPKEINDLNYETELVLQVKQNGYCIPQAEAAKYIAGITIGLDMTRRELQSQLKKQGHPWTLAKVFPDSAIIGPIIPIETFKNYLDVPFSLHLNNESRQQASGNQMRFLPDFLLSYASTLFPLCKGDLIFTGTPKGVGAIRAGDQARIGWKDYFYDLIWMDHH